MKILPLNLLFGVIVLLEHIYAAPRTNRRSAANRPRQH